ncbi:MAG: DinB family protein [Deinococcus sp.]|nr:DinB family protein [Deinococcus sp.]
MNLEQFGKYVEEVYRPTASLISLAPAKKLDWKPGEKFWVLGQLLNHLSTSTWSVAYVINGSWFKEGGMEDDEENLGPLDPKAARARLDQGLEAAKKAVAALAERDYQSKIVSAPWDPKLKMPLWRLLLFMVEHMATHKTQLYMYLKLLGQPVNTQTLYMG